jgi:hypothetical protein
MINVTIFLDVFCGSRHPPSRTTTTATMTSAESTALLPHLPPWIEKFFFQRSIYPLCTNWALSISLFMGRFIFWSIYVVVDLKQSVVSKVYRLTIVFNKRPIIKDINGCDIFFRSHRASHFLEILINFALQK